MSLHRQAHSTPSISDTNASGSTSSRSASSERSSYPTAQPCRTHHHHSIPAPPNFASCMQSKGFTSGSFTPSSSTLVSSDNEKAASHSSLTTKIPATPSPETKRNAKDRPSASKHNKLKGERGCLDLDWSYRNVYSSGSNHGRKAMGGGSGSVGPCVLM